MSRGPDWRPSRTNAASTSTGCCFTSATSFVFSLDGLLQSSFGGHGGCAQSVLVAELRSGNIFDIWDRRGKGTRGCRLDENALQDADPVLRAAIADRVDLIIINRFGRAEGLGRGLINNFAVAIEVGIPVLTAVRSAL
jgi:uncharacterized protein